MTTRYVHAENSQLKKSEEEKNNEKNTLFIACMCSYIPDIDKRYGQSQKKIALSPVSRPLIFLFKFG